MRCLKKFLSKLRILRSIINPTIRNIEFKSKLSGRSCYKLLGEIKVKLKYLTKVLTGTTSIKFSLSSSPKILEIYSLNSYLNKPQFLCPYHKMEIVQIDFLLNYL